MFDDMADRVVTQAREMGDTGRGDGRHKQRRWEKGTKKRRWERGDKRRQDNNQLTFDKRSGVAAHWEDKKYRILLYIRSGEVLF